ncbi:hypothetical protein [Paraburkholderia rhizosphaerae]|uniref:Uncharacterized protein n=1 Tax=Paraburkholderia rhizosphaerae TaxID=480658 RepID=A0A4V6QD28_9BURK|nr:hypothetical protein [Paraburkholderia rhizosphaerae]TDY48299.1 hypothetical protein BX592_111234 [Paraburkholderia rhizosphaerae]
MKLLTARHILPGTAAFIAATAALSFVALMIATTGQIAWYTASVIALACAAAAQSCRYAKLRTLRDAIARSEASSVLEVHINGVPAGRMAETQYRKLELESWMDARNYVAQFVAILAYAGNCLWAALLLVPVVVFWYLGIEAFADPGSLAAALTSLQAAAQNAAGPATLIYAIGHLLVTLAGGTWFVLAGSMFAYRLGYRIENRFRTDFDNRVRCAVNAAMNGPVNIAFATASSER